MKIDDWVEKITGSYRVEGSVRAIYKTVDGETRCVVQVWPQGFQMIYSPDQLQVINERRPQ